MLSKKRLKKFVRQCRRRLLEDLLRVANLPIGGLKPALLLRLLNYIDIGPTEEFNNRVYQEMQAMSRISANGLNTHDFINTFADPVEMSSQGGSQDGNQLSGMLRVPSDLPSGWVHTSSTSTGSQFTGAPFPPRLPSSTALATNFSSTFQSPKQTCDKGKQPDFNPFEPSNLQLAPEMPMVALVNGDGVFMVSASPSGLNFVDSPFYKVLEVIIPPTILTPGDVNFLPGKRPYERMLNLRISSDQAEAITYHSHRLDDKRLEFDVQVIVRFGKLESEDVIRYSQGSTTSISRNFIDHLPIHLILNVNGRSAQLPPLLPTTRPGLDGRRNARPINITPLLRVSPAVSNNLKVTWTHNYADYTYAFYAIYLVRKRRTSKLCEALLHHSYQQGAITRRQIMEKLAKTATFSNSSKGKVSGHHLPAGEFDDGEDDDLVIQNTLPVQLLCPLSKCRIDLPVRGVNCQHIQCYDANTYLLINDRKPAWKCPVCDALAPFGELLVDGLLVDILSQTRSRGIDEIVFHENGSWSPVGEFGNEIHDTPASSAPSSVAKVMENSKNASQSFQITFQSPNSHVSPAQTSASSISSPSAFAAPNSLTDGQKCHGLSYHENRKRAAAASFINPTRTSPSSSTSSQAPESDSGVTIDLTESDEETRQPGKRRQCEGCYPRRNPTSAPFAGIASDAALYATQSQPRKQLPSKPVAAHHPATTSAPTMPNLHHHWSPPPGSHSGMRVFSQSEQECRMPAFPQATRNSVAEANAHSSGTSAFSMEQIHSAAAAMMAAAAFKSGTSAASSMDRRLGSALSQNSSTRSTSDLFSRSRDPPFSNPQLTRPPAESHWNQESNSYRDVFDHAGAHASLSQSGGHSTSLSNNQCTPAEPLMRSTWSDPKVQDVSEFCLWSPELVAKLQKQSHQQRGQQFLQSPVPFGEGSKYQNLTESRLLDGRVRPTFRSATAAIAVAAAAAAATAMQLHQPPASLPSTSLPAVCRSLTNNHSWSGEYRDASNRCDKLDGLAGLTFSVPYLAQNAAAASNSSLGLDSASTSSGSSAPTAVDPRPGWPYAPSMHRQAFRR